MSVPVCKFYRSKKCRFGKHCRYLHSASQRPPPLSDSKEENDYLEGQSYFLATEGISEEGCSLNSDQNEVSLSPKSLDSEAQSAQQQDLTSNSKSENEIQLVNENSSKPIRKTICYYFKTFGNCRYGNECRFFHSLPDSNHSYEHNGSTKGQRHLKILTETAPWFRKTECQKDDVSTAYRQLPVGEDKTARQVRKHERNQIKEGPQRNESRRSSYTEKRICSFFRRGHCNRGDYCQFVHPSNWFLEGKAPVSEPSQPDYKNESTQPGSREDTNAEKDYSDKTSGQVRKAYSGYANELTSRSVSRPVIMKQNFTYTELANINVMKVRESEINIIKKRFPRDKITVLEETESRFSARILFSPSDPDWSFDIRVFELLITVPSNYPREMMTIVLPTDQNLPETVRRYVEISIKEWLHQKVEQLAADNKVELMFRPFLLWLDRNIEDVTMEALKQLKRELVAKAAGMEFIPAEKLQAKFRAHSESADNDDKMDLEDDGTDNPSSSGSEDNSDNSSIYDKEMAQSLSIDPEKKGTEIELRHLQLRENASALMFERLKLVLQCDRCKNHSDLLVPPGKVMSIKCEKCNQNQFVHFRAALIHQFSSVAGYLDVDGCQAFDLIFQDCCVAVTCLSCGKQTRINGLVSGHMVDGWCQACNARFKLATEAVKFVQLMPSTIDTSVTKVLEVASSKQKRPPKDPAIREGFPLPEFGTCRHYKHSYRWLRFPCCGKAYPCDVCHGKKEDHEMVYATRMICGHCCKEQNFSATRPCTACGQHLTKIRTAHWEGGSGCRDKITMSKNDQQKYKNMNKTQSNHQKKVQAGTQKKKITKLRRT